MGATASVAVLHSMNVQSDRETLLAIFPGKFQVETPPGSGSIILVEEQLTLILVPCAQSEGTFAALVLDEDMIRQAAKRAVVYGVKRYSCVTEMERDSCQSGSKTNRSFTASNSRGPSRRANKAHIWMDKKP